MRRVPVGAPRHPLAAQVPSPADNQVDQGIGIESCSTIAKKKAHSATLTYDFTEPMKMCRVCGRTSVGAAIGVSVSGKLFGGEITAGLIGGILQISANNQIIASTDTTTLVEKRIFFLGPEGGLTV